MTDTYRYLLGPHGVFTGSVEDVLASGFDPWQSQLFEGVYNRAQFGDQPFTWSGYGLPGGAALGLDYAVGYLPDLLDLRAAVQGGSATDLERQRYADMVQAAQAIPLRDVAGLTYDAGSTGTGQTLSGASPDLGGLMLRLADKMDQGTATDQERALFTTTEQALREQHWRASVPQPSDAFSPLGDNLFGALAILGTGLTGGLAAAPLVAGGAGLATTLGSLGTLAGTAGGWAGTLGGATGQDWLSKLGLGLGIAGGLAGGIGGLTNLWGTGVQSLSDAARLASSAGKVTGALGRIPGADPLQQASRYLGLAGSLGQGGSGVAGLLGASQGVTQGATQAATQALADQGGRMADFSYDDFLGWGGDETQQPWYDWATQYAADNPGMASSLDTFLGWGGDETQQPWYDPASLDTSGGGGNWLSSVLGGLGSVGKFLGSNASWLGPAASALGSLGTGLLGSQASSDAAAAQSAALHRAIDLQTAQWLQQQANQAPWLQAGQEALPQLSSLAAQGALAPFQPGAPVSGQHYGRPSPTPGWTPQTSGGYTPVDVPSAAGYQYTPGQGPSAAQYRYTPGQIPDAGQYRYTPGAVPTLSGAQLLANDPGVQFRLDEGRRALEASAAARGGLTSGATLAALQRQGQELSSQEYANAWNRAAQQAQLREQWGQTASQLGFGQAISEAQLREQVNQIASQQGWSQAQAEAAFREHLAQQAGAQNWQQGLAEQQARAREQQFGWQSGLQAQQWHAQQQQAWDQANYERTWRQAQDIYARDVYTNEQDYARQLAAYNSQLQQQATDWNRWSALAGLGQTAVGQLGTTGQNLTNQQATLLSQLGAAQGLGTLGSAAQWSRAVGGVTNNISDLLAGLSR